MERQYGDMEELEYEAGVAETGTRGQDASCCESQEDRLARLPMEFASGHNVLSLSGEDAETLSLRSNPHRNTWLARMLYNIIGSAEPPSTQPSKGVFRG